MRDMMQKLNVVKYADSPERKKELAAQGFKEVSQKKKDPKEKKDSKEAAGGDGNA